MLLKYNFYFFIQTPIERLIYIILILIKIQWTETIHLFEIGELHFIQAFGVILIGIKSLIGLNVTHKYYWCN